MSQNQRAEPSHFFRATGPRMIAIPLAQQQQRTRSRANPENRAY
jgi:hypothetical protein